jgi:carbamoyl-phosphate synthase/aspartate carbamoyltransferase/dihydroorotase
MAHIERLPGLVDAHVHLRTPGGTHKEDFATGTAAALAGGFTAVLDMPNTTPPTVDERSLDERIALARAEIRCDVGFYVGATAHNADEAARLSRRTAGLKMYLGLTYGPLLLSRLGSVMDSCQTWPDTRPVAVHAEGFMLASAIALAHVSGRRLHCCHVSRREEILLIRAAKGRGVRITCEVTPHHLLLTEDDARSLGPMGFMKPTLGSHADRQALWDNLDVVDIIASDHAPHTKEEKAGPNPPPGVPGLETTLPLLLTAVGEGRLTMERLVELLAVNPRRIFGLPEERGTFVEVDTEAEFQLGEDALQTRCGWTPFSGWKARGRVQRVGLRGRLAYEAGRVLSAPGEGRVLWN